jgi:hypothetical protein
MLEVKSGDLITLANTNMLTCLIKYNFPRYPVDVFIKIISGSVKVSNEPINANTYAFQADDKLIISVADKFYVQGNTGDTLYVCY